MNIKNIEQAIRFSDITSNGTWAGGIANDYAELLRLAKSLAKIDVMSCNGEIDEDIYNEYFNRIRNEIDALAIRHGLQWYHQSDPRGASLYISNKPLTQMNYENGIAIY